MGNRKVRRFRKIENELNKQAESLAYLSRIFHYKASYVNFTKTIKQEVRQMPKLSKEMKADIDDLWGGVKYHDYWYRWYNAIPQDREDRLFCTVSDNRDTIAQQRNWYMPDFQYYLYVCETFANRVDCMAIDDKNMYDMYFSDVRQPQTLGRKIKGEYYDEKYRRIDETEIIDRIKNKGDAVLKLAKSTYGGKGIEFIDGSLPDEKIKSILRRRDGYVLQEKVKQHPQMAKLHPDSLNTVRTVTFRYKGEVHVLSTIVRFGIGGKKVDNISSGGIFCGVKSDGSFTKYGYTNRAVVMETHPTTGAPFAGNYVPNYEKLKQMVCELSNRFAEDSQLISWDIAINEEGEPVLIEVNLNYSGIGLLQIANGPLFGDLTKDVLKDIFSNPRLRRFNRIFH